ncbi:MAG: ammonia-forming cytochrome c nitrite reductase subunit c552 [Ignavibacteria bacterium]|nr:ammonia-forming cytochrome c nitrite reductase subunit c552 [Ignavibacteria bacterium]
MIKLLAAIFGLVMFVTGLFAQRGPRTDQCLTCHEAISDRNAALYRSDVHYQRGVTCAGCHGGNASQEEMEHAMDPRAGYIGVPKGDAVTAACAKCHSNSEEMAKYRSSIPVQQAEEIASSIHGKSALSGRERLVQCTTCHGAHGILSAKNPASPVHPLKVTALCSKCHSGASYMRNYNPSLPVDQMEKYRTSEHGMRNAKGDAKVAECVSCHGSHEIRAAKDVKSLVYPTNIAQTCAKCHSNKDYMKGYRIPTDQFDKYASSVHGKSLLVKGDLAAPACNSCHGNHGAMPPGVSSISKVCGTCHVMNADLFAASPHKKAFDAKKLPECETCHGSHEIIAATDRLLGVSEGAVCRTCHTTEVSPKGYEVARTMRALIDSLDLGERQTAELVAEAEQKGMEISEAKFRFRDVRQARLQAKTLVHSFDEAKFAETVKRGMSVTEEVQREAQNAIEEYYFRRWGLGISTLIITVLAIALYFAIRRIEKHQSTG